MKQATSYSRALGCGVALFRVVHTEARNERTGQAGRGAQDESTSQRHGGGRVNGVKGAACTARCAPLCTVLLARVSSLLLDQLLVDPLLRGLAPLGSSALIPLFFHRGQPPEGGVEVAEVGVVLRVRLAQHARGPSA